MRNFLRDAGLSATLEQFQAEWYEVRLLYQTASGRSVDSLLSAPPPARSC